MWAILTEPDKRSGGWDEGQFFANGRALVSAIVNQLAELGVPRQHEVWQSRALVTFRHAAALWVCGRDFWM